MGVPDGVLAQGVQVHPLAEPGGGSVHAGLVTQILDFLTEGDGALGAILLAQAIGTAGAVGRGGSLGIIIDGVVQLAAVQHPIAALCFLAGLVLGHRLGEEIHAHLQARVAGVGEVLFKHGVLHQRAAGTVAAVADADDHKVHARLLHLVPVDVALVLGHVDAEVHILLHHAVGVKVIQLAVHRLDAGDRLMGGGAVVIGLAVLGQPAGVFLLVVLFAEQPVPQPAEKAVLAAQVDALCLGLIQGTLVQRLADLLVGQQHGPLRRAAGQVILCGVRFLRGCLWVLCGQLRRFLLQDHRAVLLCRRVLRCGGLFALLCGRLRLRGLCGRLLGAFRLCLCRGSFRRPGLFRAVRSAFFRRSRRPGLFLPEELCFLLRFRPALLPDDGLHRHSPLQVGQIHGRPQTADGQHHGHGKNSRSLAPAACRKSVVPNSFHAVLLRLRIPVLVIVCRRKSGRPFMHFHTGSVYTRCRPAVNRLDFAAAAAAHGQACVRTPEKCSKRDTFRWGKTLHKAEISQFFQQPLAVLTGVWYDTEHTFVTLTICFGYLWKM